MVDLFKMMLFWNKGYRTYFWERTKPRDYDKIHSSMTIFRTIDRFKLLRMNRGHLDLSVPDSLYKKMDGNRQIMGVAFTSLDNLL